MKFFRTLLFFVLPVYLFSCHAPKQIPNYLQTVNDTTGKGVYQVPELRIQKNDLLSIQIISAATRPEVDQIYNMPSSGSTSGGASSAAVGFLVDLRGNIEYPKLGSFHAEGLTKEELAAQIKLRLTEPVKLLDDPIVIIRFLNFKVTVLGEVNQQGVVNMSGEKMTILEAIGLAGGVTDFGLKNSVKVMREIDGQREVGVVDLSSKDLFNSPYYNLKQSDVIIVDPTPKKARRAESDVILARVGFALSVITAIALLYNIFQ